MNLNYLIPLYNTNTTLYYAMRIYNGTGSFYYWFLIENVNFTQTTPPAIFVNANATDASWIFPLIFN